MTSEQSVFIVDDDPTACESVATLAQSIGVKAEIYLSAEAFLEAYDSSRHGCLVTDVRLRGMSGLELLDRMLSNRLLLPIIVITGFADVPLAVRAMRSGAVTLLQKPYHNQELYDAIVTALSLDVRFRQREAQLDVVQSRIASLTADERRVLDLMLAGKTNKLIAIELQLGLRTVEARRHSIMAKFNAGSVAELVRFVSEAQHQTSMC